MIITSPDLALVVLAPQQAKAASPDTLAMLGCTEWFAARARRRSQRLHLRRRRCADDLDEPIRCAQGASVPTDSNFFNGDNGAGMVYKSTEKNLMPFYQEVAKTTKLRVLVYNGDTDPSINSFVAQNWTSHLGFTPTQTWRPWTIDGCLRMGGYVTRYKENFDYLTIRGSGHMVPQFKPAAAPPSCRRG